jgi:hypothetical protein
VPAIQCPSCKAYLTVKGLVNCPLCQTDLNQPLDPLTREEKRSIAHSTSDLAFRAKNLLGLACLAVITVSVGAIIYRMINPSEEEVRRQKVSAALLNCQQRIQARAEYGGADMPPYARNHGGADEFYFAWPRGSFEFPNAFGARVKMSASCNGNLATGEITSLTIDGKDQI